MAFLLGLMKVLYPNNVDTLPPLFPLCVYQHGVVGY
jgi:hypothetical protein